MSDTLTRSRLYVSETIPTQSDFLSHLLVAIENKKISHPTDTHPTTAERTKNLGIDIERVAGPALDDLRDIAETKVLPDNLEKELTLLEHRLLIHMGLANLPEAAPGA